MHKTKIMKIVGVFIIAFICLTSCGTDGDAPEQKTDNSNLVYVTKNVLRPTSWSGDSIYIIQAWDFVIENLLSIEAGCIIKFDPTLGPDMRVTGMGKIMAKGSRSRPIVFTSYRDDKFGGDNNMDGNSMPMTGDWNAIAVESNNVSEFDHCRFSYGGGKGNQYVSTLVVFDATARIENCVFDNNRGGRVGDYYEGVLHLGDANFNCVVRGNTFYDNDIPLTINQELSIDDSNTFHNPNDPGKANIRNGIYVDPDYDINRSVGWGETEVAFIVNNNDFRIESGGSLRLENGVVLKMMAGSEIVVLGNLHNHDGSGVFFTSYRDDFIKGDSNGDGGATSPKNGDWCGVYFDASSQYFRGTNVLYGGC